MARRFGNFNPRSREGSDKIIRKRCAWSQISIHAPAKGATLKKNCLLMKDTFQSTLPRRERLLCTGYPPLAQDFNPRSREGSDLIKMVEFQQKRISIHAPAKGATTPQHCRTPKHRHFNPRSREGSDETIRYYCSGIRISIHAPAKGATFLIMQICWRWSISIHAPAKGATSLTSIIILHQNLFQSTLPRRERPAAIVLKKYKVREFQSTLPRRERHKLSTLLPFWFYFNPRSREGSD